MTTGEELIVRALLLLAAMKAHDYALVGYPEVADDFRVDVQDLKNRIDNAAREHEERR